MIKSDETWSLLTRGAAVTCHNVGPHGLPLWAYLLGSWYALLPLSCVPHLILDRQFSVGWWLAIDAAVLSKVRPDSVPVVFVDFLPGLIGTLALIMYARSSRPRRRSVLTTPRTNLVEKGYLTADEFSHHGDHVAWKARTYLLVCFAAALGALGGSLVRCTASSAQH